MMTALPTIPSILVVAAPPGVGAPAKAAAGGDDFASLLAGATGATVAGQVSTITGLPQATPATTAGPVATAPVLAGTAAVMAGSARQAGADPGSLLPAALPDDVAAPVPLDDLPVATAAAPAAPAPARITALVSPPPTKASLLRARLLASARADLAAAPAALPAVTAGVADDPDGDAAGSSRDDLDEEAPAAPPMAPPGLATMPDAPPVPAPLPWTDTTDPAANGVDASAGATASGGAPMTGEPAGVSPASTTSSVTVTAPASARQAGAVASPATPPISVSRVADGAALQAFGTGLTPPPAPSIPSLTDRSAAPLPTGPALTQAMAAPTVPVAVAAAAAPEIPGSTPVETPPRAQPTTPGRFIAAGARLTALPGPVAADPAPVASPAASTPAAQAFAAAIQAADRQDRLAARTAVDPTLATTTALHGTAPVAAPAGAGAGGDQPSLDMRQQGWPAAMVDHIERLRDAADATSTRIRVVPDALGSIDVAVRRHDDGAVQVSLAADRPATQAMIADARPELAAIAGERGTRVEISLASPGAGGGAAGSGGNAAFADGRATQQQQQPATRRAPAPALTLSDDPRDADDRRVA